LVLAGLDHFVDLVNLALVPLDLGLVVVAPVFEQQTGLQHVIVAFDQQVWLDERQVIQSVLEFNTLFLELLAGVFLSAGSTLQLS
jgi:hypothetical protein